MTTHTMMTVMLRFRRRGLLGSRPCTIMCSQQRTAGSNHRQSRAASLKLATLTSDAQQDAPKVAHAREAMVESFAMSYSTVAKCVHVLDADPCHSRVCGGCTGVLLIPMVFGMSMVMVVIMSQVARIKRKLLVERKTCLRRVDNNTRMLEAFWLAQVNS